MGQAAKLPPRLLGATPPGKSSPPTDIHRPPWATLHHRRRPPLERPRTVGHLVVPCAPPPTNSRCFSPLEGTDPTRLEASGFVEATGGAKQFAKTTSTFPRLLVGAGGSPASDTGLIQTLALLGLRGTASVISYRTLGNCNYPKNEVPSARP